MKRKLKKNCRLKQHLLYFKCSKIAEKILKRFISRCLFAIAYRLDFTYQKYSYRKPTFTKAKKNQLTLI